MQAWVQSLFHFSGTSDLKHSISSNPTHSQNSWVHGGLSTSAEHLALGISLTSYIISMNYALSLYPFDGWRNLFKSWALHHILAHNRENAVYHTSVVLGLQLVLRKCSLPACVFAMHHSHCFKEERINKYAIIFQPQSTGVCGKLETQKHQLGVGCWTLYSTPHPPILLTCLCSLSVHLLLEAYCNLIVSGIVHHSGIFLTSIDFIIAKSIR